MSGAPGSPFTVSYRVRSRRHQDAASIPAVHDVRMCAPSRSQSCSCSSAACPPATSRGSGASKTRKTDHTGSLRCNEPLFGHGKGDIVNSAQAWLGRFSPLETVVLYDDFDRGTCGWLDLTPNFTEEGFLPRATALDKSRWGPPMLSTATFGYVGTHGSLDGVYSLKLATRPVANRYEDKPQPGCRLPAPWDQPVASNMGPPRVHIGRPGEMILGVEGGVKGGGQRLRCARCREARRSGRPDARRRTA